MKKHLLEKIVSVTIICTTLLGTSCKKDAINTTVLNYQNEGVFIINQGVFQTGTGTLSFYDTVTHVVYNDIFQTANGRPLGNVAQSMEIYNGKGYIVINNANRVEVVNAINILSTGVINGLIYPRYFLGINSNKGYVTQWGANGIVGSIEVVNLNNNQVTKSINTGEGAERMLQYNNMVFVANSGGFGNDSSVAVINSITDTLATHIPLNAYNPSSIVLDKNGKLWVLCVGKWNSGYTALVAPGSLVRINPVTYQVEETYNFTSFNNQPNGLIINKTGDMLYYCYSGMVYKMSVDADLSSASILVNKNFYNIGYDGVEDYLYGADAGNYSSAGWIYRYRAGNGSKVDSFKVGIIPGNFFFE